MKRKNLLVFPAFGLLVVLCMSASGCGGLSKRGPVTPVKPKSTPQGSDTGTLQKVTTDLSMAARLRELPASAYVLGAGDGVEISVYRHETLTMNATVSSTGMISYYLIGDLKAEGLTPFQLREKIQKKLTRYIKSPQVFVRVTQYMSHKVFVLGQVRNPGVYRMREDFSLVEAISAAGGIGPYGYLSGAYVVRGGKILLVNFVELIEKGNMEENIPLLSGDVVYVPSTQDRKVYVLGEVNNQSAIPLRDGLTLLGAVAEAGGFTRDARKDSIVVMRGNLSKPEFMKIDVEGMDGTANIALERGDIVYVASTTIANVERMALRLYNILQPFYNVSRSLVWGDAAVGVMEGKDSRLVIPTE